MPVGSLATLVCFSLRGGLFRCDSPVSFSLFHSYFLAGWGCKGMYGILDFNQVEHTFTPITYEMISYHL